MMEIEDISANLLMDAYLRDGSTQEKFLEGDRTGPVVKNADPFLMKDGGMKQVDQETEKITLGENDYEKESLDSFKETIIMGGDGTDTLPIHRDTCPLENVTPESEDNAEISVAENAGIELQHSDIENDMSDKDGPWSIHFNASEILEKELSADRLNERDEENETALANVTNIKTEPGLEDCDDTGFQVFQNFDYNYHSSPDSGCYPVSCFSATEIKQEECDQAEEFGGFNSLIPLEHGISDEVARTIGSMDMVDIKQEISGDYADSYIHNSVNERGTFLHNHIDAGFQISNNTNNNIRAWKIKVRDKSKGPLKKTILTCDLCNKTFTSFACLTKHVVGHLTEKPNPNEKRHKCSGCDRAFLKRIEAYECECRHAGIKPYPCEQCGLSFGTKKLLKSHKRIHSDEMPFECELCKQRFKYRQNYYEHRNRHLGIRRHECEICLRRFAKSYHLKVHLMTHTGERPFQCELCPRRFTKKNHLVVHRRTHTGDRPFMCSECGSSFFDKNSLTKHQRTHNAVRAYGCPECGKRFSRQWNLANHMFVHNEKKDRPFLCDLCGTGYTRKDHMMRHRKLCSGVPPKIGRGYRNKYLGTKVGIHLEKQIASHLDGKISGLPVKIENEIREILSKPTSFVCDMCGSGYSTKKNLARHKKLCNGIPPRLQKGVKSLKCDLCGRAYSREDHLKSHRLQCNGKPSTKKNPGTKKYLEIKSFPCDHCGSCFSRGDCLKRHQLTCSGLLEKQNPNFKSFLCSLCGACYNRKDNLTKHQKTCTGRPPRVSTGIKKFICNRCGIGFTRKARYEKHKLFCLGLSRPSLNPGIQDGVNTGFPARVVEDVHKGQPVMIINPDLQDDDTVEYLDMVRDGNVRVGETESGHNDSFDNLGTVGAWYGEQNSGRSETLLEIKLKLERNFQLMKNDNGEKDVEGHGSFLQMPGTDGTVDGVQTSGLLTAVDYNDDEDTDCFEDEGSSNCFVEAGTLDSSFAKSDSQGSDDFAPIDLLGTAGINQVGLNGSSIYMIDRSDPTNEEFTPTAPVNEEDNGSNMIQTVESLSTATMEPENRGIKLDSIINVLRKEKVTKEKNSENSPAQDLTDFVKVEPISSVSEHKVSHVQNAVPQNALGNFMTVKQFDANNSFSCTVCARSFRSLDWLNSHLMSHLSKKRKYDRRDRRYKCSICGLGFQKSIQRYEHECKHLGFKPFVCDQCGAEFAHKQNFKNHQQLHTDNFFECSVCQKQFKLKSSFRQHQKIHLGIKKHQCEYCGKQFSKSNHVARHRLTHFKDQDNTGTSACPDMLFPCRVCLKTFPSKYQMENHAKTHQGIRQHFCEECEKYFASSNTLLRHRSEMHSGDRESKQHPCAICGKSFSRRWHLDNHMWSHRTDKPHVCDLCGSGFSRKDHLKRHLRSCGREKPRRQKKQDSKTFVEDIGKDFGEEIVDYMGEDNGQDIEEDIGQDFGEDIQEVKPHVCDLCGSGFSRKDHLKRHVMSCGKERSRKRRKRDVETIGEDIGEDLGESFRKDIGKVSAQGICKDIAEDSGEDTAGFMGQDIDRDIGENILL